MRAIVVLGGSITGLAAGLMLARAGRRVLVLEREASLPTDPTEASDLHRPTVPQYQHAHSLSAGGRLVLEQRLPDVLDLLHQRGAQEYRIIDWLPPTARGADRLDRRRAADLRNLACRRSLLESTLRTAAMSQPSLTIRSGVTVVGLEWQPGAVPRAVGVRTREAGLIEAELIVDASGRRSALDRWLRDRTGRSIPVVDADCELVSYTRFYRLRQADHCPPTLLGLASPAVLDGCAGFAFRADNGGLALVMVRHPADLELAPLRTPDAMEAALGSIPTLAPLIQRSTSTPISGVNVMAGIRATFRRMLPDGDPVVSGVVPIGDALATTNPAYGRGLTHGFAHAALVADALTEAGSARTLEPSIYRRLDEATWPSWYDAYRHDRMRIEVWRRTLGLPPLPLDPEVDVRRPWLPLPVAAASAFCDAEIFVRWTRAVQLLDSPADFYGDSTVIKELSAVQPLRPPASRADVLAGLRDSSLAAAS